jgi:predicted DNA-binding protein
MSNIVIGVRMPQEIKELLDRVSKNRGEDVSDFVRRSVLKELASLNYLSVEEKKALGVRTENQKHAEEV